jgi:hypothetical protein
VSIDRKRRIFDLDLPAYAFKIRFLLKGWLTGYQAPLVTSRFLDEGSEFSLAAAMMSSALRQARLTFEGWRAEEAKEHDSQRES